MKIVENKLSRIAYYVAFIPFVGIPAYFIIGLIALITISLKCNSGLSNLQRGLVIICLNLVVSGLVYFMPHKYNGDNGECGLEFGMLMQDIPFYRSAEGYVTRDFTGSYLPIGDWYYYGSKKSIVGKGKYSLGKKVGLWLTYYDSGEKAFLNSLERGDVYRRN